MYTDQFLALMRRVLRRHAIYAQSKDAWVISTAHFEYVFLMEGHLLPPQLASMQDLLAQGTKRSLWHMDIDHDTEADIVILK